MEKKDVMKGKISFPDLKKRMSFVYSSFLNQIFFVALALETANKDSQKVVGSNAWDFLINLLKLVCQMFTTSRNLKSRQLKKMEHHKETHKIGTKNPSFRTWIETSLRLW